ncbi:MAG: rhodanese-like domain-containing protein [Pseudomonadota bacterium]
MTTERLDELLHTGKVALFDVRGDMEFEKGHLPGAMTAPLGSLTFRVASVMKPDSLVVVYSAGGACHLAADAAVRLQDLRMTNVQVYEEGVKGWQEAGLPMVASNDPKSQAWGPVTECRPLIVDRENAYGGVFKNPPDDVEGAGG